MTWSRLDLGVGIVVSAGLDLLWDDIRHLVDVVEVEPQTMWTPRQDSGWDLVEEAFRWVENLRVPTIAHGVGFPVGGCEPPEPAGVALAAFSARRLVASHWSEHLSFNRARVNGSEIDAGFLLPPAQTWAGVDAAADHVASYRAAATLPFLIETGVNYLRPRPGELSDGAFIAAVADRGDCAILLDLHNLLANERNGREPVSDVLGELPLERVLEVHVAGGFRFDGYYLDAHIGGPDGDIARAPHRGLAQTSERTGRHLRSSTGIPGRTGHERSPVRARGSSPGNRGRPSARRLAFRPGLPGRGAWPPGPPANPIRPSAFTCPGRPRDPGVGTPDRRLYLSHHG